MNCCSMNIKMLFVVLYILMNYDCILCDIQKITDTDNACSMFQDVVASSPGLVEQIGYNKEYGNYIKIKQDNGEYKVYSHLYKIFVCSLQRVQSGYKIALSSRATDKVVMPYRHNEEKFLAQTEQKPCVCESSSTITNAIDENGVARQNHEMTWCYRIGRYDWTKEDIRESDAKEKRSGKRNWHEEECINHGVRNKRTMCCKMNDNTEHPMRIT